MALAVRVAGRSAVDVGGFGLGCVVCFRNGFLD